jgi:hypothetical protein
VVQRSSQKTKVFETLCRKGGDPQVLCAVNGQSLAGPGSDGGTQPSGFGVHGIAVSNTGVVGTSDTGFGIHGASKTNTGVVGTSDGNAFGVHGIAKARTGVVGTTATGIGVHGVGELPVTAFAVPRRRASGAFSSRRKQLKSVWCQTV